MADEDDRPRGIFTPNDRAFITGAIDYDGQDKRNARYRAREHTKHGLRDLPLVLDLELRDWEKVRAALTEEEREEIADAASELVRRLTGSYSEDEQVALHKRLREVEERLANLEEDA